MSKLKVPTGAPVVATFKDWVMYDTSADDPSSLLWMQFKVQQGPDTRRRRGVKRSFKLNWNPAESRLARNHESHALMEQQPELYDQVVLELGISFNRDWLLRHADEGEIAAEQTRLAARRAQRVADAKAVKAAT